jgi:outer membrane beta-barrel protein
LGLLKTIRGREASTGRVAALGLTSVALMLGLSGCSLWPTHSSPADASATPVATAAPIDTTEQGAVIDPETARRKVVVPHIKNKDWESGVYVGVLSTQELQSALTYGVRASYHINEDFFLEGEYGRSSVSDQVRREIGQPFFPKESMDLSTYGLDLGYNFLPGEVFFGSKRAMTSTFYLLAGVGDTGFNGEDYLTYSAGFGVKVLPADHMAIRLEARDRIWQSDLLGTNQVTNNLEMTLGFSLYF